MDNHKSHAVRIDKWLWAARFFKTRALAKAAVESGKVQIDGHKSKPSRLLETGITMTIRQGLDEKTIVVQELSAHRRGAPEAQLLYAETPESIARREARAAERKAQNLAQPENSIRPNKKQRRQIHRFLQN
jgi:ribosome-associated heat shock protein Hsp15